MLADKTRRAQEFHQAWNGYMPPPGGAGNPEPRAAGVHKKSASRGNVHKKCARFESIEAVEGAGFKRVASCMYRKGHSIWELRQEAGGEGYVLVRKREERLVDMRSAGAGVVPLGAPGQRMARVASSRRRAIAAIQVPQPLMDQIAEFTSGPTSYAFVATEYYDEGQPVPVSVLDGIPMELRNIAAETRKYYGARHGDRAEAYARKAEEVANQVEAFANRVAQVVGSDVALDEGSPLPEPATEEPMPGEEPQDFAEELYDAHEVLHGREPVVVPQAPLVQEIEDVVDEEESGYEEPPLEVEPLEDFEDDFMEEEAASGVPGVMAGPDKDAVVGPCETTARRRADAPPGAKWERMVRELKDDPDVDNPYAVAWAQHNKTEGKEGGPYVTAPGAHEQGQSALYADPTQIGPSGMPSGLGTGEVIDPTMQVARARLAKGQRVLALRKGGVGEGVVLELMPLGDLMADFGEGPEELAIDNVLEPELDLSELEVLDEEVPELDMEEPDADDDDEDADDDEDEDGADDTEVEVGEANGDNGEPQVLVIRMSDVIA
jgi:hypothetical protein